MSGKKFDQLKDRWDLLSWPAIQRVVDTLTYGASVKLCPDGSRGYGERNWEDGLTYSRVFGALMRHLLKAWHGTKHDPESGLKHIGQAGVCWMFLCHYLLHPEKYVEFDDRPLDHNFRPVDFNWTYLLKEESDGVDTTPAT